RIRPARARRGGKRAARPVHGRSLSGDGRGQGQPVALRPGEHPGPQLNVLVCVKRVPETGARITLTPDAQAIDTTLLGVTISPHEECAVEEAVRIAEQHGGSATVLTLGPPGAVEQLQNALAMGVGAAVLLETDGSDWNAEETAAAIADAIRARPEPFDLLLFGNEAADSGDYQVGVRVAHLLGLPCVTGIK